MQDKFWRLENFYTRAAGDSFVLLQEVIRDEVLKSKEGKQSTRQAALNIEKAAKERGIKLKFP